MEPRSFDLRSTFLQLAADGSARQLPVGPDFWSTIQTRTDLDDGRLLMVLEMERDWPTWEIHPAGDEVVLLLEGSATMILDLPGGAREVALAAGEAVLVPRGTWHTADLPVPCRMLFLTPGRGTENRVR